jgi:hypothetical protein
LHHARRRHKLAVVRAGVVLAATRPPAFDILPAMYLPSSVIFSASNLRVTSETGESNALEHITGRGGRSTAEAGLGGGLSLSVFFLAWRLVARGERDMSAHVGIPLAGSAARALGAVPAALLSTPRGATLEDYHNKLSSSISCESRVLVQLAVNNTARCPTVRSSPTSCES